MTTLTEAVANYDMDAANRRLEERKHARPALPAGEAWWCEPTEEPDSPTDAETLDALAYTARRAWESACKHDRIDPSSKFVAFSKDNPYVRFHNAAIRHLMAARKAVTPDATIRPPPVPSPRVPDIGHGSCRSRHRGVRPAERKRMEMRVYVVMSRYRDEDCVMSIFSTRDRAEEYVEKEKSKVWSRAGNSRTWTPEIEEWKVEGGER